MLKLLLTFVFAISSAALAATPNHCTIDEQVLFNCLVKGSKKIASVCGKITLNKDNQGDQYIQYRFGLLGKIEFEYPKTRNKIDLTDKFRADTQRASNSEFSDSNFAFQNDGHIYEIWYREELLPKRKHSASIATWKAGDRGVAGKTTTFICTNTEYKEIELNMYDIVRKFSSPNTEYWMPFQ